MIEAVLVAMVAGLVIFSSKLCLVVLAPRCPFCGGRLDARDESAVWVLPGGFRLVRRRFNCAECLYEHQRLWLTRSKEESHETDSLY